MNKLIPKAEFSIDMRFDFFYALQLLFDGNSRIHEEWKASAKKLLGNTFLKNANDIVFSSDFWALLSDAFDKEAPITSFEDLLKKFKNIAVQDLQTRILSGAIHSEKLAHDLINNKIDLKHALAKVPNEKQEWLAFIGLYPFDKNSKIAIVLSQLIDDPEEYKKIIISILIKFWEKVFSKTWNKINSELSKSLIEKERLFSVLNFNEFAVQAHLRIMVDDEKEEIKAIRGGYKINYKKIEKIYFSPSIFNEKRFWTAFCENKLPQSKSTIYFPYFESAISLDLKSLKIDSSAELDSYLIFKTLGDSTRYAIAKILAQHPTTAMEITKILSLTKATVSHHLSLFRQAGILQEEPMKGSIKLSLNKTILQNLNNITIKDLYEKK